MALTLLPAVLQGGIAVGTSPVALYTVPAAKTAVIKRGVFVNTGSGAANLTVTITRAGAVAVTIISAQNLAAGAASTAPELANMVLATGDAISASGSAIGINAFLSGFTAS